ncbi:hypothetical protein [Micromonospora eburnea]|uniref:hypothetical protein n=1 Tax=Micromonospora eburnea TaxID=227316 RepID=UPI00114CE290|nr:hypothetical protein [Micromonospora eburnea]
MAEVDAVRDSVWREAYKVTREWEVVQGRLAQAAMNARLGSVHQVAGLPIEWVGAGRLKGSMASRELTRSVNRIRRDELAKRLVLADEVAFLRQMARTPGDIALWWAAVHPEKLSSLLDGSIAKVIELQPGEGHLGLDESNDPSAKVIRAFLESVSDPSARPVIARYLEVVNKWVAREAHRGGGLATPPEK